MKVPIEVPPVKEMSKYEKIRLNIIKEREQAMAESGFFDDLLRYKKKHRSVVINTYKIYIILFPVLAGIE